LEPLTYFVIGVAVYAISVSNSYRFMGRRDIFYLNLEKYETSKNRSPRILPHLIFYVGKYPVLSPIVAFVWLIIVIALLTFLAKTSSLDSILLVSMSMLATVWVTAYCNEDLS
jgi:hypothetical protein